MSNTETTDSLLVGGTNQGVERSVLPMPQVSLAFNVRMRKGSRWGKRYGHTALTTGNLGAGTGRPRAIGGARESCFAVVDDTCYGYDLAAADFVPPSRITPTSLNPSVPNLRTPGAVSGWLPDTAFFPVPARDQTLQTSTPCAVCYAFGYLWTAMQYTTSGTDITVRVVATNVTDNTLVRVDDFVAPTSGFGGTSQPKLVLVGSTLVCTYFEDSASPRTVKGRNLTSAVSGWSAETTVAGSVGGILDYDICAYSSTQFLLAAAEVGAPSFVQLYTATTFAGGTTQNIIDSSGNPLTAVSVAGFGAEIYVGYACSATPASKVRIFTANLAGTTGTVTLAADSAKPLLTLKSGSGIRVVFSSVRATGSGIGSFTYSDVSSIGVLGINYLTQVSCYPVSSPFMVASSGSVYIWCRTDNQGPFYPVLLRLPDIASSASAVVSLPIECSPQDLVTTDIPIDLKGVPTPTQIGSTAAYAVVIPTLTTAGGTANSSSKFATGHDYRVVQLKHFTDSSNRRSIVALPADSSNFLPMGALTRVDDRGATEEGFLHTPTVLSVVPSATGSLTASSDYFYTAVFKSRNANGRIEQSAPCSPVKVTMGAGQQQNTLILALLGATARPSVSIEVYRTLSNGQTYYLCAILSSNIFGTTGTTTFVDRLADTSINKNAALYIQVGQTLPNAFPPPSRFGCVGGQRLFLGGLTRGDVVQGSKLIFGDQSPSFADSDAFRIVLPQPCTGLAWMDVLTMFTAEGIYIASGDGPDDSGNGDFGNLTRMPYEIGCIEPRSIKVVDDGCFFQTDRGLYLLPRGFGAPVPAGDNVMDSLAQFPVITGVATVTKAQEQSVVWVCSNTAGNQGVRIVYDLAHKAWSVDNFADSSGNSAAPCGVGQWAGGELAQFATTVTGGLQASNSAYSDANNTPIQMQIRTGDLRPFGVLSEGAINKVDLLAEVRSSCTMNVTKTTELGTFASQRVFTLAGGDYQIGDISVTETELGAQEFRDAMSVRVQYDETSTGEGVAFIALSLEHERGEGLKRATNLSRNT